MFNHNGFGEMCKGPVIAQSDDCAAEEKDNVAPAVAGSVMELDQRMSFIKPRQCPCQASRNRQ